MRSSLLPLLSLLLVAACGSKSALESGGEPSRPNPSLPADAAPPVSGCEQDCGSCTPVGPVIAIAERGQRPDVAFGAGMLLVAHDDPEGNALVAVSLAGERLWSERLGGTQRPRIAYDRTAGAGLVAFDSGVRWLGADGRPVGEPQRLEVGYMAAPDVAAVEGGFTLVIGAFTFAEPPPLYFARVGTTPGPIDLVEIAPIGPWHGGEHAVDEWGRATLGAVSSWEGPAGFLFDLTTGRPPEGIALLELTSGPVLGMARGREGEVLLLRNGRSGLKLQRQVVGEGRGVDTWLGMDPRGQDGHLVALGERSVALVTSSLSPSDGVTLGCVDPRSAMSVSGATELAERPTLSVRATATPEGLAVVWTEQNDAGEPAPRMRLLDCCI